jgi:molecular chaperone HscB
MTDYFAFFDLPVSFRVDAAALRRAYLENSRKHHPDFHTLADDARQEEALEFSTRNNEAYRVLSDPDARMKHVLELYGALEEEGKQTLPQDFLMTMMEMNEALMELEMDFDADKYADTKQQLAAIEQQLQEEITPVLNTWTADNGRPEDIETVKFFFLKKRYLLRIQKKLLTFAAA